MSNETIKGKYWTLRLKNKYIIPNEWLPQKDSSHATIPTPGFKLEIGCWNEKHELTLFTNNCFGHSLNKTSYSNNANYAQGYLMEVQIKLKDNLPNQLMTSMNKLVMTSHGSYSPSINMKRDAYRDEPSMMHYRMRDGIYPQIFINKRTGSYLMYKLSMEGEETDRWGNYQYPTGNNQVVFKYADRKNDIYATTQVDRSINQNYEENLSYIGRPAFVEIKNNALNGYDAIRASYLRMARSRVYPRQFHPSYNIKNYSGDYISQPNSSYSSGSFYRANSQFTSIANTKSIVHIHFASNSIYYIGYDRLNSNTTSVSASLNNMDNNTLNSSTTYNLKTAGSSLNGAREYWDYNDNNIIIGVSGTYMYALNIGNDSNLNSGRICLPNQVKMTDKTGNYVFSSWRSTLFERATNTHNVTSFTSFYSVRINNNNICSGLGGKNLYITKYDAANNSFINPEILSLPFLENTSSTYIASAINENDEIVIVDLYGGNIYIYQIESDTPFHSFGLSSKNFQLNNTEILQDPATIEEAISVEVKHTTGIEHCEIVISPRELDDPNLIPLDGRILLKTEEPFLYKIFGDNYYTNEVSQNSFKLPDLRGRYPIGRENSLYEGIDAQIQSFSLESLSDFGFNPINNQIKKYYKSTSAKAEVNLTNDKAVKSIRLTNSDEINTTRKSVSIDDKCFMFYIRKVD